MPKFLEKKLKEQYGANSSVPYKIMNKLGFMSGNQETAKGRAAEAKHNKDKGIPGEKDKEKETGAGLMGKAHSSKPVTEEQKHMSRMHKNNRAELDTMDGDSDELHAAAAEYDQHHAEDHIEDMKKHNRLILDDKKKNKTVEKLLKKIHKG